MIVFLWNNFLKFHIYSSSKCMSTNWFVFATRTPESIPSPTSVFFWTWWFFSWEVFFHGHFWNTGFLRVWLQLCNVRQVFIIWSFTFFSPIIFNFRSTVYKFKLWHFYDETCFIFKICVELFGLPDILDKKALSTIVFWCQWSERD